MINKQDKIPVKALLMAIFTVLSVLAFGQKPVVNTIDKTLGSNQEKITFQGSSFGTDPSKLAVFFGATRASVGFVSDQLLEVNVPPGATFEPISISHVPSGLTEYTKEQFLLSFGGVHGFPVTKLEGQKDFNSESGLYDLCSCDFDGDQKVDIATANDNSNSMNIFANTTPSPGLANINFNKIPFLLNTRSLHVTCGDLNGDGKPELVVSEGGSTGDRVFIFHNTSTGIGNFTFNTQFIRLLGRKVKRVKIGDLDRDGKPELVVTNQSGNNISILVNQSTPTTVSFSATPINVTIPGAASTDGLAINDLNGDHLPELVLSQFLTATSNIFLVPNNSTVGSISMGTVVMLPVSGTVVNIRVGDLDLDGKPDIAVTQLLASGISIFLNQGTAGSLAFSAPVPITTEDRPWGIDFGDLDGDGKNDIAIASLTKKTLTVLNNESTPGNLSFQTTLKPTTFINRHINIGDVDGDGKPDVSFTSIDDNNNGIPASKISILRNTVCLQPAITPLGPHTICVGFPLRLFSNISAGATYQWKNGAATVASGPNAFFDVIATGNYSVTAVAEGGTCSLTSNTIAVTVEPGITSGPANPINNGPICIGSTLTLSVNDVGATQYKWTGPNGYTGTGLNPASIPNFQTVNAGRYDLDVIVGTCVAQQVFTVVEAIDVPDFQINTGGTSTVCPPATKTLTIAPNLATYTYQWFESTSGIIAGATGPSYNAAATGDYYVQATYTANPSCATAQTPPVRITFASAPVAAFTSPGTVCVGQNVTFTNQSTSDPSATIAYSWEFGDGNIKTDVDPVHRYLTASTFTVKLTASYNGACPDVETKNITVQAAPAVTITNPNNKFSICPGDSLKLEVLGTFTSYLWNTGKTGSSIFVKQAGTYSVDVTTATCTISDDQVVGMFPEPDIDVTIDPQEVNEGGSSQLTASGLVTYLWEPAETLSNATVPDPIASPLVTTSYKVSGRDVNGCAADTTIEVRVKEGLATTKVRPAKFFSPDNGDDVGKFWNIERIEEFPHCRVSIYDDKGIKVYEAKPFLNDTWDGTFHGRKLPDGVYYYKITCDGEENSAKTGSITLLR